MKNILMTTVLAATLAIGLIAADGGRNPTFATTSICGSGPGPVCYLERTCTGWAYDIAWLKFAKTCASWVEKTFYWEPDEEEDSTSSSDQGEAEEPQAPTKEG